MKPKWTVQYMSASFNVFSGTQVDACLNGFSPAYAKDHSHQCQFASFTFACKRPSKILKIKTEGGKGCIYRGAFEVEAPLVIVLAPPLAFPLL